MEVLEEVKESAKREFGDASKEARDKIVSQLIKLLHPNRFIIENRGPSWGNSGSLMISPKPNGGPVGLFLCGYPDPTSEIGFVARHFKVLQVGNVLDPLNR